jgi:hypothetical protein
MKRLLLSLLACLLLALSAECQRPTTIVQLLNASTSTGRTVVGFNDLIGAGAHYFTYCTTASFLQIIAEESPDNVSGHFVPISTVYGVPSAINGNPCAVIQVGGMYGYPAVNVLGISGGSVSVWYSGTVGIVSAFPPASSSQGAGTIAQCDHTIAALASSGVTNELIIGTSTQSIHVCDFTISFSGAPSAAQPGLIDGTNSTCTTGQQNAWEAQITSSTPQLFSVAAPFTVAPSHNLCYAPGSPGVTTLISVSYAQY